MGLANGVAHDWYGLVWLNPPYSRSRNVHFADKLLTEIAAGRVIEAIGPANAITSAGWIQLLMHNATAIGFPCGRIRFVNSAGKPRQPLFGQVFIYFGPAPQSFADTFTPLGVVLSGRGEPISSTTLTGCGYSGSRHRVRHAGADPLRDAA